MGAGELHLLIIYQHVAEQGFHQMRRVAMSEQHYRPTDIKRHFPSSSFFSFQFLVSFSFSFTLLALSSSLPCIIESVTIIVNVR